MKMSVPTQKQNLSLRVSPLVVDTLDDLAAASGVGTRPAALEILARYYRAQVTAKTVEADLVSAAARAAPPDRRVSHGKRRRKKR